MYRGSSVAVVVPAYQEERFVGDVVESIPEYVDRAYVVDDGSTDGTWREIRRHAVAANLERVATTGRPGWITRGPPSPEEFDPGDLADEDDDASGPLVVPIKHGRNRGAGAAIKTGYRRALDDGMDVIAVVSGDGQMDTDYLPRVLDPVVEGRADYAKGTRLSRADHRAEMSGFRLFGNVVLTALTRVATGYWGISDPQNGFTAISSEALSRVDLSSVYDRYGFLNDLLARLSAAGVRVVDVPHPAVYGDEESWIRLRTFVPRLSALLAVRFGERLVREVRNPAFVPAGLAYLLGVVALLAGVLGVALGVVGPSGTGVFRDNWPALAGTGVAGLLVGVALDAGLSSLSGGSDGVRIGGGERA